MTVRAVRLGSKRLRGEGLRLGAVRRPPRGVRKSDYGKRNYFDLWFPELGPSPSLLAFYHGKPLTPARWAAYRRRYLAQMGKPAARRMLALLAALSRQADFSVGCYCEDARHCHRSLLRELLRKGGAKVA